jgi:methylmalonyl-CoA mutase cobalamin-binding subunit
MADSAEAPRVVSPAEVERAALQSKFHPSIVAVIDRLKDKNPIAGVDEVFIREGKADVQIWLTDKSEETLAKLKELGFEVVLDPKSAKLVIGRLPIEKLGALAELKFIRFVAPQTSRN